MDNNNVAALVVMVQSCCDLWGIMHSQKHDALAEACRLGFTEAHIGSTYGMITLNC